LAELFEQHLAQVLRCGSWLARRGHAIDRDRHAFVIFQNSGLHAGQLRIGRDATREFLQKWSPEKTIVDVIVEDARRVNETGELGCAFLRLDNLGLTLSPISVA